MNGFSDFFSTKVEEVMGTSQSSPLRKVSLKRGEEGLFAISYDTKSAIAITIYSENTMQYFYLDNQEDQKLAEEWKIGDLKMLFPVNNVEKDVIEVLVLSLSHLGKPNSLATVVQAATDREKFNTHLLEICRDSEKEWDYSAKMIPDIPGVDCGHSKIDDFAQNNPGKVILDMCGMKPITLQQLAELEPDLERKIKVAKARAELKAKLVTGDTAA